jgi:mannose-6-phosphate isomerase-like protein (cupin superfamily)
MSNEPHGVVLQPSEGETLQLGLTRPTIKVSAAVGSVRLGVIDSWLPPGGGFPFPHWHEDLEEAFYVLEGEIDYLTGTTWITAGPGSTIFVPATVTHAFRNTSGKPARHLAIGAPAEMVELVRDLGAVSPGQFEAVHERHRSHFARQSPHFPRP